MEKKLFEACKIGDLETVKFLAENGADIRAQDDTPIFFASTNGHLEIVKYLFSQGTISDPDEWPLFFSTLQRHL